MGGKWQAGKGLSNSCPTQPKSPWPLLTLIYGGTTVSVGKGNSFATLEIEAALGKAGVVTSKHIRRAHDRDSWLWSPPGSTLSGDGAEVSWRDPFPEIASA